MPTAADILWFKTQFHQPIEAAVASTPFDLDMLTAIACQETGHIWARLRKKPLTVQQILSLCVGDTIDAKPNGGGRRAFPKTKAELVAAPNGQKAFGIARQALLDMAQHITEFRPMAGKPNKFCHGFGIFQFDLQHFKTDPDFFLQRQYENFDAVLQKCLTELRAAQSRVGHLKNRKSLTDLEMAHVCIAYNAGRFIPAKGLKQGHFDGTRFYGEAIFDFLRLSRTIAIPGGTARLTQPAAGNAIVPPATPVAATGPFFEVDTRVLPLRLRSEPRKSDPESANVIAHLPDGHPVRAITGKKVNGFTEVETSLNGAHLRGFASAGFLKPATGMAEIPLVNPAATLPTSGIVAVTMPRRPGTVTRRSEPATAHSLNESRQPKREGTAPDALRAELWKIVDWLDVEKHKRYLPRDNGRVTFCNIYAHDYCHLAGVYLPRVWWTPKAIEALAQGKQVAPLIGNTIEEQRANALFRWLSDFGPRFGWRQTGELTKLQQEVNEGAIGLIVARRKEEGRPGHMVMVVPEPNEHKARRNASGEVIAPLQSQAGVRNFRFGIGKIDWWRNDKFADSAFWIHS